MSNQKADDLVKLSMMMFFCDFNGAPPIDTQLQKIDKEFDRIINESGLRETPEYKAVAE